ncbi:sex determination protein fruitless isoform X3 [Microplitis demolitor]|uniref:sex determination protein fruitless isoform X3 n=1 Tax=Microplitis demolitor TaxID=69319 RepID=UPI00235B5E3A|nr:sex determination protein fruitless isoform X3 [Microplitis demolitor]
MTDSQQQFCLRWNNFQANITSQFEALRDDEDFVDVTFACDGRRLQAHKVVLSACSPYFKELFKTNPCKHPIIFMRDVEFEHLQSLLEFMYAGEVNISQAELPTFLRTAESLQIRGLTDSQNQQNNEKHSKTNNIHPSNGRGLISPNFDEDRSRTPPASSPPPLKRLCKKSDSPKNSSPLPAVAPCTTSTPRTRPVIEPQVQLDCYKDLDIVEPKVELPEYGSDEDYSPKQEVNAVPGGFISLDGGMEVLPTYPSTYQGSGLEGGIPGPSHGNAEPNQEQASTTSILSTDGFKRKFINIRSKFQNRNKLCLHCINNNNNSNNNSHSNNNNSPNNNNHIFKFKMVSKHRCLRNLLNKVKIRLRAIKSRQRRRYNSILVVPKKL